MNNYKAIRNTKKDQKEAKRDREKLKKEQEKIKDLKSFLDKYYPLPDSITPTIDINQINRIIWYCNHSGIFISELWDFKKNPEFQTIQNYQINEEKCLALDFYKGSITGKPYNKYRIFQCGHCILDVFYLCSLYDNLNFPWKPPFTLEKAEKLMNHLTKTCPLCINEDIEKDKLFMYYVSSQLNTGTILMGKIIPKKYLNILSSVLEPGTVVDTEGYRGIGLYLLDDDNEFKKIPTEEYHPIWPLKWVKIKGYAYYANIETFDAIPFESDIFLTMDRKFHPITNRNKFTIPENEDAAESPLIDDNEYENEYENNKDNEYENDQDNEYENDKDDEVNLIHEIIDLSKAIEIQYPFIDANQANDYLKNSQNSIFKFKLNDFEYLIFKKRCPYIADLNGKVTAILFY